MRDSIKEAVNETVKDLHSIGLVDKITVKKLERLCNIKPKNYTSEEIKAIRSRYGLSQAALAKIFNISPSTIKKWEQGKKSPSGAAKKLIELIDEKGLEMMI